MHSFGAQFEAVRVNEFTEEIRVPRQLDVFAVGRIVNTKSAHSRLPGHELEPVHGGTRTRRTQSTHAAPGATRRQHTVGSKERELRARLQAGRITT
ncbi:hypothetical protein Pen02_80480 [Plantactinospora endophytica]|uniref:Uncharacterized protein n=1 Tax=Plantactinospora endophytica TaxID=673535 RepID=A0ABQ4EEF2_9ACTN|nr:hypothetical protein Pen02_80480 [Plantactinospora endophytica]